MPNKCVVCGTRRGKNSTFSFHRFPKVKEIRKQWVQACKVNEQDITSESLVCSKHFKVDDFDEKDWPRKKLVAGVVPTPSFYYQSKKNGDVLHGIENQASQEVPSCTVTAVISSAALARQESTSTEQGSRVNLAATLSTHCTADVVASSSMSSPFPASHFTHDQEPSNTKSLHPQQGPIFGSAVKREMEVPASELVVKKEYDPYESIGSNYSGDHLLDYDIHARNNAHNYLDNECIKQEMVKSEKTDSTLHCLELDNSALPRIVKNDNDFEEDSKDVIGRQIEFMDAHDSRNIIDHHSLNNEVLWTHDCQKGNRDLNSFNECFKEEMVDYGQINTPSNQISMRVENEVDFKELLDNEFVKKEIEFVVVQEEKHIVDQCLYNEKQMENPDELGIKTKIAKIKARCQKEYCMHKKIQKQQELELVRKKRNAERAKRYRRNLKLKKQQAQIDALWSSKEDFNVNKIFHVTYILLKPH